MRDELRPLEGKTVVVIGRVNNVQLRPEGHFDVCFRDVEVRELRYDMPQMKVPAVKLDHLWFLEPPKIAHIGSIRLFVGRVLFYTRKDGSLDIGVTPMESLCLSRAQDALIKRGRSADRDERALMTSSWFSHLIEEMKAGRAYYWDKHQSAYDLLTELGDIAVRLRKEKELNETARLSSTLARIQRTTTPNPQPCIPFL